MFFPLHLQLHRHVFLPQLNFRCKFSISNISSYKESFAKKMALAGIKPNHRIAVGVSGGPDSMALCLLIADWKSENFRENFGSSRYIDGVLGVVVDHRLRCESADEARIVQERVMRMGIKCEISCCNWPEGKPYVGNLQEAAREMRYQNLQDVCAKHQIGVLLVAHHADDQAELFILRLSRNSGVYGLAGMAFVSQLFSAPSSHSWSGSNNHGVLLIRPMLELSKGDIYKICESGKQVWVEDPTNQSMLFARNRIRNSLRNLATSSFSSEMKTLLSACRLTRLFIENISLKLLEHSVSIVDDGYGIIDLEKLDPLNVGDLTLSKFLVMILQFISQRQRPIRGSVMKLLLDYIRNIPCKTSLTAAGCYLCAAPRSKGTKVIVCYSPESPCSSKLLLSSICCEEETSLSCVIEQIIRNVKLHSDKLITKTHNIPFLHANSSETMLREAVQLNLISQSTLKNIRLLQIKEHDKFCSQNGVEQACDSRHRTIVSSQSSVKIYPGQTFLFMHRFLVTWKLYERKDGEKFCPVCRINQEHALTIRHMVDADWLYLAKLSESKTLNGGRNELETSNFETGPHLAVEHACSSYMKSSVQTALQNLKNIPAAARRALPVFVNTQNLLLCIPSVGFSCCPCLSVLVEFRPRVPLGGGYCSYL